MPKNFSQPGSDLSPYAKLTDLTANFVNSGAIQTVAEALANFPAGVAYVGKYARVSDLWGSVDEVMRCSYDGNNYYWRPQRTDYAVSNATTSGTMTLTPLTSAPQIFLTATLLGNLDLALSTTNVWPGCQFMVVAPSSLGIFTLRFTGLVGGAVSGLLGGSTKLATYTAAGWRV